MDQKPNETEVDYNEITELESLCMKCREQGKTKIMMTKIPFYKDIVIMSFLCDKCGFSNNEIQSAMTLEDNGIKFDLKVTKEEDLNRLAVASTFSVIFIPELDLEIPKVSKGIVSTIQGFLDTFIQDLEMNQEERKKVDPEGHQKLETFLVRLTAFRNGEEGVFPFHVILDDPSGNSFIANPFAPLPDVNLHTLKYKRTKEQLYDMGHISDQEFYGDKELQENYKKMKKGYKEYAKEVPKQKMAVHTDKDISDMMVKMQGKKLKDGHKLDHSKTLQEQNVEERVAIFHLPCNHCGKDGEMRSITCEIPFFKEIVIMSYNCDECGYKDNEVKTGGEISDKAKKITLFVEDQEDLNRDLFKSDTATVTIPELDFTMQAGSLGSLYTTVEGLLLKFLNSLKGENPFVGDSAEAKEMVKFYEFLGKLEDMKNGKTLPFTLILDDPVDNCFVLNPFYPKEDPKVEVYEYNRTAEQDDELGINLIDTGN